MLTVFSKGKPWAKKRIFRFWDGINSFLIHLLYLLRGSNLVGTYDSTKKTEKVTEGEKQLMIDTVKHTNKQQLNTNNSKVFASL